jgi:excisionase family DNA binding protein
VTGRRPELAKHFGQLASAAAGNESFLNVREVAELLRVSDRTVSRWVKGKKLVAHQFGGATRISAIELSGFITRAHRGPAAPLQPRNPLADQFYTAEDVAEILNVSKRTVCRYIKSKMLIVHKFGRPTRIADSDLRDFIDRSRRG